MEEIQEIIKQNEILKKENERIKQENVKLKVKRQPKAKNPIALYSGGKKQYDEKEQEEFLEEEEKKDVVDITTAKGTFYNPKTDKEDTIKLQPHQKGFLMKFINSDARGAILFHGTGTGKTLTAVATSSAFLRYNPNQKVFVITPSATLQNFIFGMVQYGLDIRDNRYKFYTYDRYFRHGVDCDGALMIIDEAHNFRTFIQLEGKPVQTESGEVEMTDIGAKTNKKGYKILEHCAKKAKKVLLLTATPFINVLYDLENLIAMTKGIDPLDESTFYNITSSKNQRKDYFQCLISKFALPVSSDFPEKRESLVPIYMDKEFLEQYYKLENSDKASETAFFNGVRRISNAFRSVNNSKVNFVMDLIKPNQKIVIYTTYLENGILLLKNRLDEINMSYAEITGRQNAVGKEISKNRFNHFVPDDEGYRKKVRKIGIDPDDPEEYNVNILLITKASAEGVDLIGTNAMVLMDGAWNESAIQQIVARAVRYRSHTHLPKDQQHVNIYRMVIVKPTDKPIIENMIGQFKKPQWDILLEKFLQINELYKKTTDRKFNIKHNKITERSIMLQDKTIDNYIKKDESMSVQEVMKLKMKDRRKAWAKVQHDRLAVEKKQAETLKLSQRKPAVDLYMLVRSKAKQIVINNFVGILDTETDTIEKCISPLEQKYMIKVNELQEQKGREITPAENDAIRKQLFSEGIASFARRVQKNGDALQENLTKTLQEASDKKKKALEKQLLAGFQEYFTPPDVAREMIKKVGLEGDKRDNLKILEPTAGNGALIEPLLERMGEGKQFYLIDAVEFKQENREILKEYTKTDNFRLMNEGNFLKFVPPKKYDYVLMNPPFHLRRTNFPNLFKRDVWDVDFVKRAFGMLDVGGRLIALTSQASLNNDKEPFKSFNKWIKDKNHSINKTTIKWKGSKAVKKAKEAIMKRLKLTDFLYIILVKEEKDMFDDNNLLEIDEDIFIDPNTPLIAEDIPAKLYDNKVQDVFVVDTPKEAKQQERKEVRVRKGEELQIKTPKEKEELKIMKFLVKINTSWEKLKKKMDKLIKNKNATNAELGRGQIKMMKKFGSLFSQYEKFLKKHKIEYSTTEGIFNLEDSNADVASIGLQQGMIKYVRNTNKTIDLLKQGKRPPLPTTLPKALQKKGKPPPIPKSLPKALQKKGKPPPIPSRPPPSPPRRRY